MTEFADRLKDSRAKIFVFVLSCGHQAMIASPPIAAMGLKGTYAFCRQHGKVRVTDVHPAV